MVRIYSYNILMVGTRVLVVFFLWNFWMFKIFYNVLNKNSLLRKKEGAHQSCSYEWLEHGWGRGRDGRRREKKDTGQVYGSNGGTKCDYFMKG